jgi:hypothetical protein
LSVVSVVCLSGRGLCDGLITRPEESYRLWCVIVYDLGTSRMRRLKLRKGCKCWTEEEEEDEVEQTTHLHGAVSSKRFRACGMVVEPLHLGFRKFRQRRQFQSPLKKNLEVLRYSRSSQAFMG